MPPVGSSASARFALARVGIAQVALWRSPDEREARAGHQSRHIIVDESLGPMHPVFLSVHMGWTDIGGPPEAGLDGSFDEALASRVSALISGCGGTVIAKSGDEVLCVMPSLQPAIEAVPSIHQQCTEQEIGRHVALRIGIHASDEPPTTETEWAYCVSSARQLANLARSGQALVRLVAAAVPARVGESLTPVDAGDWVEGPQLAGARLFLLNWQDQVTTRMVHKQSRDRPITRVQRLRLRWRSRQMVIGVDSREISLGRGGDMDITVDSEFASRHHARIRPGSLGFILTDTSTNGTYINLDESIVFIHGDEIILRGQGWISLGRHASESLGKVVYFSSECAEG